MSDQRTPEAAHGNATLQEELEALRVVLETARSRSREFRMEADTREHKEYWGGRYAAYTLILDQLERILEVADGQ